MLPPGIKPQKSGAGGGAGDGPVRSGGRSVGKATHSRSYPRGVGIDFRKLAGLTLMSYIDHHGEFATPSIGGGGGIWDSTRIRASRSRAGRYCHVMPICHDVFFSA